MRITKLSLFAALVALSGCAQQFAASGHEQAQLERENRDLRAMLAHTRRELRQVRSDQEQLQNDMDRLRHQQRSASQDPSEAEGPTVSLAQPPLHEYGMALEEPTTEFGGQASEPGLNSLLGTQEEETVHRPYVADGQYRGRDRRFSEETIMGDSAPGAQGADDVRVQQEPGYGATFSVGEPPPSVPRGDAAAALPGIGSIEPSLRKTDPELLSPPIAGASMPLETAPPVPTALRQTSYGKGADAFANADFQAAVMAFRDFMHNNPDSAYADDAQYWIGESYLRDGAHSKAIIEFNQVVIHYRSGDRAAKALLKQAEVFSTLGDDVDARLSLQKVVNHFAGSPEAAVAARILAEGTGGQAAARR